MLRVRGSVSRISQSRCYWFQAVSDQHTKLLCFLFLALYLVRESSFHDLRISTYPAWLVEVIPASLP